jgi:hypothetical protein
MNHMKKIILSLGLILPVLTVNAQKKVAKEAAVTPSVSMSGQGQIAAQTPPPASGLNAEHMNFKFPVHDFKTVQEGPAAEHEFVFTNTGKEPIVISNVSASCGCTTPSYSKEPVLPGKTGTIKASYNTQGRVGPFTKSITINSNAGVKVLTIKGEVEKAPSGSAPENNSMMKTN